MKRRQEGQFDCVECRVAPKTFIVGETGTSTSVAKNRMKEKSSKLESYNQNPTTDLN